MKKLMLAIVVSTFLFSTSFAAKYESIFLSEEIETCVDSMQLEFSHLTSRIEEDEKASAGRAWVNPFRNIDRSIRMLQRKPGCLNKYEKFRDRALLQLNTNGKIGVYGPKMQMRYFLRFVPFYYAGN